MIRLHEAGGTKSEGTIDDYLSGREEYELDRRSYKGSGFVGAVRLIGYGNITIQKTSQNSYIAPTYIDGKMIMGKGSSPKKAFFDLLKKLKELGYE